MVKKIFIGLTLSGIMLMANNLQNDDLLNLATAENVSGIQVEMSDNDMIKANGGYTNPTFVINGYLNNQIYALQKMLNPAKPTVSSSRISMADMYYQYLYKNSYVGRLAALRR